MKVIAPALLELARLMTGPVRLPGIRLPLRDGGGGKQRCEREYLMIAHRREIPCGSAG